MSRKGFSLVEIVVAIGILSMIILAFDMITNSSYKIFYYNQNELSSLSQATTIMRDFERTVRSASKFEGNAFDDNAANKLTFYSYQKGDDFPAPSKISYYFESESSTTLKKSVIAPVPDGGTYDYPDNENKKVTDFAGTITDHDIFTYFDESYKGTGDPLNQPIQATSVRVIKISVTVAGKVSATESTSVQLRNMKTNL